MNIDLFEMNGHGFERQHVRKPDGTIVGKRHPQMTLAMRSLQIFEARRFCKHGIRSVPDEERGGSQLHCSQQR
jgi:hypothetical protein